MSPIRTLHTSDWHLGKRLYRKDREEEHALFLSWLLETLKKEKIDVLLLAGDVFDSPTPPHSSLKLYYDFLKAATDLGVYCVIISGNHDSQGLINAPGELLKEKKIVLAPGLGTDPLKSVTKIQTPSGELWVKTLPYFRNYELIKYAQARGLFDEEISREEIFKASLKDFFQAWPEGDPAARAFMGHHVFGNYSPTGSEHFIGLTGIESIPLDMLKDQVDYAALGHIHKYQHLSASPETYYTGSPIQMRFSERKEKYINIVSYYGDSKLEVEKTQIPVARELIQVKTNSETFIEDIKNRLSLSSGELPPFVEVQMDMKEAKTGLVDLLKSVCEEKGAELLSFLPNIGSADFEEEQKVDVSELDILELFKRFYQEKFPEVEQAPEYMIENFKSLVEEAHSDGPKEEETE